jgi:hypothetical protein
MKTTLAIRMLLVSRSLSSAMPASAAALDGALVGAVFADDPAIYALPAVDLSPSARACQKAYLGALPRPIAHDGGQTMRHPKRLLAARRDFVARQTLAMAGGKGLDDARRFAHSLTLHVEWEGMSEPPSGGRAPRCCGGWTLMVAGWLRWAAVPYWLAARPLWACSCPWLGAFLDVAPLAPLVVRAEVLRHGVDARQPTLVLRAKETFVGGLLDSGLVVAMGDGMHCRPDAALFPPGSEWILALNGPGAKPGTGSALSHCGQYWPAVDGDQAVGAIDGPQGTTQTITLAELRAALAVPRYAESFDGEIGAGETYSHWFGPALEFALLPVGGGWEIAGRHAASPENLARLSPRHRPEAPRRAWAGERAPHGPAPQLG